MCVYCKRGFFIANCSERDMKQHASTAFHKDRMLRLVQDLKVTELIPSL
jgi:hypothetical protein